MKLGWPSLAVQIVLGLVLGIAAGLIFQGNAHFIAVLERRFEEDRLFRRLPRKPKNQARSRRKEQKRNSSLRKPG